MKTKNEHYSIYSDIELLQCDASVRMHWNGEYFGNDVEDSKNYFDFAVAGKEARRVQEKYPEITVMILHVISGTEYITIELDEIIGKKS